MSLLIDLRQPDWMDDDDLAAILAPLLPGVTIHTGQPTAPMPDVRMLVTVRLLPGQPPMLPGLEVVMKTGAGVETLVGNPDLPEGVRLVRMSSDEQAMEIARFCLMQTLKHGFHDAAIAASQARAAWDPVAPRRAADTPVVVLGLGHIGARVAILHRAAGFPVIGWSRTPKTIDGIDCRAGAAALTDVLGAGRVVCAVLPSTPATAGLMGKAAFAAMRDGALFVNVGRGDLVDEVALRAALRRGRPGHAVLDVVRDEPLPADSPLWAADGVTITPHVSGWNLGDAFDSIAETYRSLVGGVPLAGEVDRGRGY